MALETIGGRVKNRMRSRLAVQTDRDIVEYICADHNAGSLFACDKAADHTSAQVRRRSWAPKRSIPISLAACSTTDQIPQSLSSSPITFPDLERRRSSRPSSIFASAIQALMA